MRELVANKVDIIVATGNELSPKAALAATNILPIVMIAIDYDPLALGYVGSLARPGGNLTGLFYEQIDLTLKRLQLMQEAVPNTPRITVFWDSASEGQWRAADKAAAGLGLQLHGAPPKTRFQAPLFPIIPALQFLHAAAWNYPVSGPGNWPF